MGRLIDADKFKVYLQEYLHYGHAIPWVDAQPTAYDVEKVVGEMKKLQVGIDSVEGRHHNMIIGVCIDIVKRGGVE